MDPTVLAEVTVATKHPAFIQFCSWISNNADWGWLGIFIAGYFFHWIWHPKFLFGGRV